MTSVQNTNISRMFFVGNLCFLL